jgi:hypothetical protein
MTKEELATRLDGRECGREVADHEMGAIKAAGLVVLYGASDDLLELRGVIYDELGAYHGRTAILFPYKNTVEAIDADCIRDLEEARQQVAAEDSRDRGNLVHARWCAKDYEGPWFIESPLPYAPFHILHKGRRYCRGIVLDVNELN